MSVPVQPEESITAVEKGYICASRDVRMFTRLSFPKIDLFSRRLWESSCLQETSRFVRERLMVPPKLERTFLAKSPTDSLSSSILRWMVRSSPLMLSLSINERGNFVSFLSRRLYLLPLGELLVVLRSTRSKQIRRYDGSINVCDRIIVLSQLLPAKGYKKEPMTEFHASD